MHFHPTSRFYTDTITQKAVFSLHFPRRTDERLVILSEA